MRTAEIMTWPSSTAAIRIHEIRAAPKNFSHEAVYRIRLYNLYCLFGGVLEACDKFSAVRIRTHTQTEHIYDIYYNVSLFSVPHP